MGLQGLSYPELLQLVELVKSSSQFSEFRFRSGDVEIELRRGNSGSRSEATPAGERSDTTIGDGPESPAPAHAPAAEKSPAPASPASPASSAPRRERAQAVPEPGTIIRSPMVGTFYRAPEPGAAPFVEVGAKVEPDTRVCIIEVMKLMNSIPAGCQGTVTQILVEDGEAVEYGQALLVIGAD